MPSRDTKRAPASRFSTDIAAPIAVRLCGLAAKPSLVDTPTTPAYSRVK